MKEREEKSFWAAIEPLSPRFAEAVMQRFDAGIEHLKTSNRHARIQRAWSKVYSRGAHGHVDDTEISAGGNNGEVLHVSTKRFARLLRDQIALVVQTPPDYEPMALNTDHESQAQVALVQGIMLWYRQVADLSRLRVDQARMSLMATEGWKHIRWEPTEGQRIRKDPQSGRISVGGPQPEPYLVDNDGAQQYQGDFVFSVRSPYEVVCDRTSPNRNRPRWVIVKEPASRWDLLAELEADFAKRKDGEELKQAILDAPVWTNALAEMGFEDSSAEEYDDSIPVYWVYVERCAALPDGVKARVLDDRFTLNGGPLDEDRAGVLRLAPEDTLFTSEGHSHMHDGMGIDDVHSAQFTTMVGNHDNFGQQRVLTPRMAMLKPTALQNGLTAVEYDHYDTKHGIPIPKPEMLASVEGSSTLLEFYESIGAELDTTLGGSGAQRGDPSATRGDSGAKVAALLAAVQSVSSAFLQNVIDLDGEEATFIIGSLRRHATVERVTTLVGRNQTHAAKMFVGSDLDKIPRVLVRRPNPARDTFAGRMQLADMMLQAPPELRTQLEALIVTGRLETITESPEMQRVHLERENQMLLDLKAPPPTVYAGEPHLEHIKHHTLVTYSPEVRNSPELMARVNQHNQEHLDAITMGAETYAGDALLMATGQKPIGHIAPDGSFLPGPPARPGGPEEGAAPQGGPKGLPPGGPPAGGAQGPRPGSPAGPVEASAPDLPRMPKAPDGSQAEMPVLGKPVGL